MYTGMDGPIGLRTVRIARPCKKSVANHKLPNDNQLDNFAYLNRVLNPKYGLTYRVLWAVFVAVATIYCTYQVWDRLNFLLSEPVVTEVRNSYNNTVKYPSVTICPEQTFVFFPKIHALKMNIAHTESEGCAMNNYKLMDHGVLNYSTFWNYTDTQELDAQAFIFSRSQLKFMPHVVHERHISTCLGNCITYSVPKMVKFTGLDELFIVMVAHRGKQCSGNATASFLVHEETTDPTYKIQLYGRRVSMHEDFSIYFTAKHFSVLDLPRNPCVSSQAHEECHKQCIEKEFVWKLKCKSPGISHLPLTYCSNESAINELQAKMAFIISHTDVYTDCKCNRKCRDTVYQFKEATTSNSQQAMRIFAWFEKNRFEIVTEKQAYSFVAFVGDVGSNCGLFLGLCVLSIIETIEGFVAFVKTLMQQHA